MAPPEMIVEQLNEVIANPEAFASQSANIIQLARKAAVALEGPFETFQRLAYSPLPLVAARIAQEHGLFKALGDGKESQSATALAAISNINPKVLDPLLDYMSTNLMVDEVSPGQYKPTKLTHMLQLPLFVDGTTHFHDNCLPAFFALNQYLSEPNETRSSFEIGQHSSVDFYTWLESHPPQAGAFHRFMEAQFASLPSWLSVMQFDTEIIKSADSQTPIFVDVGGGNGQQCVSLCKKFPELPGRIILQDRPKVLEKAITDSRVERMPYDYLTEQPIKGASAYYFRQIFHNNNDETCLRILKAHLPAMAEDSVILIDDKVLPDVKPQGGGVEYMAALSLAMLAMFQALERREDQWRKLLTEAGFVIREIRRFTDFGDSIIIATPKR